MEQTQSDVHELSKLMFQAANRGRKSLLVPKEFQEADDWEQVKQILREMDFTLTVHGPAGRYKVSW